MLIDWACSISFALSRQVWGYVEAYLSLSLGGETSYALAALTELGYLPRKPEAKVLGPSFPRETINLHLHDSAALFYPHTSGIIQALLQCPFFNVSYCLLIVIG